MMITALLEMTATQETEGGQSEWSGMTTEMNSVFLLLYTHALSCTPPYAVESPTVGTPVNVCIQSLRPSSAIAIHTLLSSLTDAVRTALSTRSIATLLQLLPLSPQSIFVSPDPPRSANVLRGQGVYVHVHNSESPEKEEAEWQRGALRYSAPELDDHSTSSLLALSHSRLESASVFSPDLLSAEWVSGERVLNWVDNHRKAHADLSDRDTPAIDKIVDAVKKKDKQAGNIIAKMLSFNRATRPSVEQLHTSLATLR